MVNRSDVLSFLNEEIQHLTELRDFFTGATNGQRAARTPQSTGARGTKGGMSAEARARMSAAQKARWAKRNHTVKAVSSAPSPSHSASRKTAGKRTMSAEARKRIAAAQRARWAKQRKASAKGVAAKVVSKRK